MANRLEPSTRRTVTQTAGQAGGERDRHEPVEARIGAVLVVTARGDPALAHRAVDLVERDAHGQVEAALAGDQRVARRLRGAGRERRPQTAAVAGLRRWPLAGRGFRAQAHVEALAQRRAGERDRHGVLVGQAGRRLDGHREVLRGRGRRQPEQEQQRGQRGEKASHQATGRTIGLPVRGCGQTSMGWPYTPVRRAEVRTTSGGWSATTRPAWTTTTRSAYGRGGEVVQDDEHGVARTGAVAQVPQERGLMRGVEGRGRLVEQQHGCVLREHPREQHPRRSPPESSGTLAARQGGGPGRDAGPGDAGVVLGRTPAARAQGARPMRTTSSTRERERERCRLRQHGPAPRQRVRPATP